ncbi:peptidoglycan DD-metalloendopeptidase family protein [Patescibacteria group bacterium]|nr:peptidoglycan DD-metalloendopeptidase family protein [Patescibacteria group bacterium]MBU2416852.1 peptidoglycan DD-metalloendopeptidase family protein [Patescibacteria group bacterium]
MKKIFKILLLSLIPLIIGSIFFTVSVSANTIDELKSKINARGNTIEQLEKDINKYKREIIETQAQAKTLKSSIYELDLTRKKLLTDVKVTNNKIESTNYILQKIQEETTNTANKINDGNDTIGQLIRNIDEMENTSLVEMALANAEFSVTWNDIENMQRFRGIISDNLKKLKVFKKELENKKLENETEKKSLLQFEDQLLDQKKIVETNKKNKNYLLSETKNQESTYQTIVANKKAAKEVFEKELADFESQLKTEIDRSRLPALGSGALGWPLKDASLDLCSSVNGKKVANCVTQYFGNTAFARSGAYNGSGHNGIDFRAAVGEPVYASASGTIKGVGNTDLYTGCYSYGKWILVEHDNGLSTLYAHLSLIKVKTGQYAQKGDIIGYSGNTGYSTGPHLHYGVYASEGVQIVRLGDVKSITNCANAYIPVAPFSAYLNPIDYLSQKK